MFLIRAVYIIFCDISCCIKCWIKALNQFKSLRKQLNIYYVRYIYVYMGESEATAALIALYLFIYLFL